MEFLHGWVVFLSLLACLLAAVPASAQPSDSTKAHAAPAGQLVSLYNKWEISPSLTSVILNTDLRVDASNGDFGTTIDAEDDLGLATVKLQPRIDARLRLGRRHELEGGFQFAQRTGETVLQRDIEFADTSFAAGANLNTVLNTNLLFLNYRYAIIAKDRTQAGVGVGLGALFFSTELDAGGNSVSYSASKSLTPPVGSLGVYGRFLMSSRWSAETDVRVVKLQIDRFHVRYLEANLAGRYFLSRNLGLELGGGLDAVHVDVDPRFNVGDAEYGPSSEIKFSLTHVRLGVVSIR
jgi:hypothetical protein